MTEKHAYRRKGKQQPAGNYVVDGVKGKEREKQQRKSAKEQRGAKLAVKAFFNALKKTRLFNVAERVLFGQQLFVFKRYVNFRYRRYFYAKRFGKGQGFGRNVATENAFVFNRFALDYFGDIVGGKGRKFKVEKVHVFHVLQSAVLYKRSFQRVFEKVVEIVRAAHGQVEGKRFFFAFAE